MTPSVEGLWTWTRAAAAAGRPGRTAKTLQVLALLTRLDNCRIPPGAGGRAFRTGRLWTRAGGRMRPRGGPPARPRSLGRRRGAGRLDVARFNEQPPHVKEP